MWASVPFYNVQTPSHPRAAVRESVGECAVSSMNAAAVLRQERRLWNAV